MKAFEPNFSWGFITIIIKSYHLVDLKYQFITVQSIDSNESNVCVQVHPQGQIIHKGVNPEIDSYSAFFDNQKLGHTQLEELLVGRGVSDVYVCGIAADVCVGESWHN